jgi:hypothetical protein
MIMEKMQGVDCTNIMPDSAIHAPDSFFSTVTKMPKNL